MLDQTCRLNFTHITRLIHQIIAEAQAHRVAQQTNTDSILLLRIRHSQRLRTLKLYARILSESYAQLYARSHIRTPPSIDPV